MKTLGNVSFELMIQDNIINKTILKRIVLFSKQMQIMNEKDVQDLKIAVIGSEKNTIGFQIAGLTTIDGLLFTFDEDCDPETLKASFNKILVRTDIGLVFIGENFYEMLLEEIKSHKNVLPSILKIPKIV